MKTDKDASMLEEETENDTSSTYLKVGRKRVLLRTIRAAVFSFAILILGFGLGYQFRDYGGNSPLVMQAFNQGSVTRLEREQLDFALFWQVWDQLEGMYIEPEKINQQAMIYGAIEGMTAALDDPYTVFLPPAENQQAKEDLSGAFDGVGIQLGYKHDTVAVMAPLEEHPAIKQGVKAGDLILNIKDEGKDLDTDTIGMTLPEAVTHIRGKKGTPVTLTLFRESKGRFDVTIVRDTIVVPSVVYEFGEMTEEGWKETEDGKVVWLKLRRFGDRTQPEWDEAVREIVANKNGVDGIILDMRNNPGGYLNGAIDLASDFIAEGVVVKQESRHETIPYTVSKRARLFGVPVVVLINEGSASASEILAGALRDRLGVKLVGERSFGKGTVQEALDLTENAGLHVTTARWLLPNGDWIHEDGLEPDVEVLLPETDEASESGELIDTQLKRAVEELLR